MQPQEVYSTVTEALHLLTLRRQSEPELVERVRAFLNDDIPACFRDGLIFYFGRHVASPNRETVHFLETAARSGLQPVLGQDHSDVFTGRNSLKRALGKLCVVRGKDRHGNEIVEHVTVVDFNLAEGRPLSEIKTFAGVPLTELHLDLFNLVHSGQSVLSDESGWITRNHRGDLIRHYEKYLALFVVHGVMSEYFPTHVSDEQQFFAHVLLPAYRATVKRFGHKPLIVPTVAPSAESGLFWEAYPEHVYELVRSHAQ